MAIIDQGVINKLNEDVATSGGPGDTFKNLSGIIKDALDNFILPAAFFLVMLYGILGAIQYFTAYGVEEKATKGKKMMTYAIIGAIIVASAWLIVRYVGSAAGVTPEELNKGLKPSS